MKTLGFGGMVLLCGALAACSSSSTDGAGGGGTGGGDGGGDDGTGGATTTATATGTTTTTTTGSPVVGSTGSGPACGIDEFFGPNAAACDACLLSNCCAEAEACVSDQANCITAEGTIDPDSSLGGPLLACLETDCAGEDECGGGGGGVCESGISFGNEDGSANTELNACLGDACCDEFTACTANGADVNACIACIQAEGEPGELCAAALACADENCFSDVCGTGIGFGDKPVDDCLTEACCDEYTACIGTGSQADLDACLACLNSPDGGELCDAATACTTESGCVPAE